MGRSRISHLAHLVGARPSARSRREFLLASLATGASLMLADQRRAGRAVGAPHVVIIGAGFAGLSCGHQLQRAGARVTLLEARPQVGGRVRSLTRLLPGQVVEAAAERIGLNHPTWLAYARQFQLPLEAIAAGDGDGDEATIVLQGQRYSGPEARQLWNRIETILQTINREARSIDPQQPWRSAAAPRLDRESLLEASRRWPGSARDRHGALTLIALDRNATPAGFSFLALLAAVAGGGGERYWTESEALRCSTGNQSLAQALTGAIGEGTLRLRSPVGRIDLERTPARVTLMSGEVLEADAVVLTAPPSTWDELEILPALPAAYRMGTGPAIQVLNVVPRPFWRGPRGAESWSDGPAGRTWQGGVPLRSGGKGPACLTLFAGGEAAGPWLEGGTAEREALSRRELEQRFPAAAGQPLRQSFWLWARERWTRCGTSAPAPGEVTRVHPLLERGWQGKLFFAGEYASPCFFGSMEGALHSGVTTARRLAGRLNLL